MPEISLIDLFTDLAKKHVDKDDWSLNFTIKELGDATFSSMAIEAILCEMGSKATRIAKVANAITAIKGKDTVTDEDVYKALDAMEVKPQDLIHVDQDPTY